MQSDVVSVYDLRCITSHNKHLSQQIAKRFKNKHRKNTFHPPSNLNKKGRKYSKKWCKKSQTKDCKYGTKKELKRLKTKHLTDCLCHSKKTSIKKEINNNMQIQGHTNNYSDKICDEVKCGMCYNWSESFVHVQCEGCIQYLNHSIKLENIYNKYTDTVYSCTKCKIFMDICCKSKKSIFCQIASKIHPFQLGMENPIIRTKPLNGERLTWKFKSNIYVYKVNENYIDQENRSRFTNYTYYRSRKSIYKINYTYYRIIRDCDAFSVCGYNGCDNKEYNKPFCWNHHVCPVCYIHNFHSQNVIKCVDCQNMFCYGIIPKGLYDADWEYNDLYICGTKTDKLCKKCSMKRQKCSLFDAINSTLACIFYNEIINIIYEYSCGYSLICGNYKRCNNMIQIKSLLDIRYSDDISSWKQRYKETVYCCINPLVGGDDGKYCDIFCCKNWGYVIQAKFGKECYERMLCDYISNRYIRMFCTTCISNVYFKYCDMKYCGNRDILYGKYKKSKGLICMNHEMEKFQCSSCLKFWRDLEDCKVKCEICKKQICEKCIEKCTDKCCDKYDFCKYCIDNVHFHKLTKENIWKLHAGWRIWDKENEILDSYIFNDHLMEYDFILSSNKNHHLNNKKIPRKSNKTQKNKSYWKRKNDRKGNRKYYKKQSKFIEYKT